jgi:iron complex outermembrane receptor protein
MRVATSAAVYGIGSLLVMGAAPAVAQTAPSAKSPDAQVSEVIVTGSRISRRDYVSESPITTVTAESVARAGSPTVETVLNQMPQVSPSASASANFTSRAAQASVDLRGMGQQRTLVLLDGRRMQPSGSDGTVDLNVIPTALIDNVEVITGGASATYGSDAVTGVVNFKLKKHFSGAQFDLLYGETSKGDGATSGATITAGANSADDRGNAYVSLSYSDRKPIKFTDRDYLSGQVLSTNMPGGSITVASSNLPSQAQVNSIFSSYGLATAPSRTSSFSINPDGTLYVGTGAVNYRGQTTSPYRIYNGNAYTAAGDYFLAQVPLTRYSVLSHGDYALSNNVSVFADALFTHYSATTQGNPLVVGSISSAPILIPVTNPFVTSDLAKILASRPNPTAGFNFAQSVPPVGTRQENDAYNVFQLTTGANGHAAPLELTWSAYASYGRTELLQSERNYISSFAVQVLVNAADGGRSLCAGGYNFANIQTLSAACADYIRRTARNTTTLEQQIVEADAQGRLFSLPAGDLKFAVGADYRRNTYSYTPDELIRTGELANYKPILPSSGSDQVNEFYGELLVPIVRDASFARTINLDLGYRYSDYDVSGGVSTYKADGDWSVNNWLRLRGGYARAVRAPSVGELFAARAQGLQTIGSVGVVGQGEPCDITSAYRSASSSTSAQVRALCLAQGVPAAVIDTFRNTVSRPVFTTSGNTNLKPEVSDTYTFGVVLKSPFSHPLLSRLTASIDYYEINLDKAIGVVTNPVAVSQCFSTVQNPTLSNSNYYCQLLSRDANTGQMSNISNPELNLGGYRTSGVDVQADWSAPVEAMGLGDHGVLKLSTVVNYLDSFQIQTLPGGPKLNFAGTIGNSQIDFFADAHPRWKATSSAIWDIGPLETSVRWRYIGEMANASNVGTGGTAHGVSPVSYFDLDLSWNVQANLTLRGGFTNLLDKKPPTLNSSVVGGTLTDLYTYDIQGRRFFIALKAKF